MTAINAVRPSSPVKSRSTNGTRSSPTIADAVLDRLIHNAHRLTLKGDSMRKITAQRAKLDAAKYRGLAQQWRDLAEQIRELTR
jgi:IstB-like ATP binding protein